MRKLLIFLLAVLLVFPAVAQNEEIYTAPDGSYTFPIPTNWTVEERDGYVYVYTPEERIKIYILVDEAQDDLEASVAEAWGVVDPAFDLPILTSEEITDPGLLMGFERGNSITYQTEPTRLVVAGASVFEGVAYVTLIEADLIALQERFAQFQVFGTGFRAAGMDEDDLTSVEPAVIDEAITAELEAFITEVLELAEVPGLSLAIVQNGEMVYSNGFGVIEQGSDEPVTAETLMLVASTTKAMTTMAMAALVDEGAMTWDTPVIDLLPSFQVADPEITETLTVRNLVCACTGVPRRDFELLFNQRELTAEDIVAQLATFRFFTDFGEAFQYSNQLVAMGGFAAALANGAEFGNLMEGYYELMQTRIFDPIGMTATTFSTEDALATGMTATSHAANLDNDLYPAGIEIEEFIRAIGPAGGAWSNVEDMAKFMLTAMNRGVTPDGTRIVSEENLDVLWEPQISITSDTNYGLGWFLRDYKGLDVIGHDGNALGFTSLMQFLPEDQIGLVVLTNGRGANALNDAVFTRLMELVYDQEPEILEQVRTAQAEAEANEAEDPTEYVDVDMELITPYEGEWTNPELGAITLTLENGVLTMDTGDWVAEVRAVVDDQDEVNYLTYDTIAGIPFDFTTDESGNLVIVIGEGVEEYTFTRPE
ncbi:MAG: hypothetical protein OHK0046_40650 [Anaerolineae bacterium]